MQCKPKTRLNVILRDVRFGGVWRLETGGWNAAQEMPGMVELISSLQERGVVKGLLTLAERKTVSNGKTNKFAVPALALDEDIEQLAAGASRLGALAPASTPELAVVQPSTFRDAEPLTDHDEEPVDAEIVEENPVDEEDSHPSEAVMRAGDGPSVGGATPSTESANTPPASRRKSSNPMQTALVLRVKELAAAHDLDHDELRKALARGASKGETEKSSELDREAKQRVLQLLDDIESGDILFKGIENGQVKVARKAS